MALANATWTTWEERQHVELSVKTSSLTECVNSKLTPPETMAVKNHL